MVKTLNNYSLLLQLSKNELWAANIRKKIDRFFFPQIFDALKILEEAALLLLLSFT
jgi:hypothetical protein